MGREQQPGDIGQMAKAALPAKFCAKMRRISRYGLRFMTFVWENQASNSLAAVSSAERITASIS